MTADYAAFLESKRVAAEPLGFEIAPDDLNPMLFPFQRAVVSWALRLGSAALFADTGLGKTPMQLEWAQRVVERTNNPVLIFAPLAVSAQTKREGEKFGVRVEIARSQDSVTGADVYVTNYEMMDRFDPGAFTGVVLDESSILKQFTGKTRKRLQSRFSGIQYKLCCTATPAPNDHMELGNHSEFLGVMPGTEMLARWFINNTMHFGQYRLKYHAVSDFWRWVASWAACFRHPRDIGFADQDGFDLPPLNERVHVIEVDTSQATNGMLFRMPTLSATDLHAEMRMTAQERAEFVASIMAETNGEPWLVWCHTNYEADALKRAIPGAVDVRGSDSPESKERALLGFVDGEFQTLITKPKIAGFGMNLQRCANVAFVGMSYSYESYYQAVRRCWRFGQTRPVTANVVMAQTETKLYETVMTKARAHDEMARRMYDSASAGLRLDGGLNLITTDDRKVHSGQLWTLVQGDCVEAIKDVEAGSIDFTIFSPPFSSLYIYTNNVRDMGNSAGDPEFFEHFRFLCPELLRVTRPGRLCAVHCKNLVYYQSQRGTAGLRDFRGDVIRAMTAAGWDYHSEVTIWKDPVTEMQRTKAQGLLHKQLCKDSTYSRQGLPDYLVIFRKWPRGENEQDHVRPVRVDDDYRFVQYVGERGPTSEKGKTVRSFSIETWQRYASPVWFDINQMNVLNTAVARDDQDEKHICPLQLDVIERAVHLWTNEDDLVFSPFAGIGSEGVGAIRLGRRFLGIELKDKYVEQATRYLAAAEQEGPRLAL